MSPPVVPPYIVQACRLLTQAVDPVRQQDLAQQLGVSLSHLHRSFRRYMGMSLKAYADACRAARLREVLTQAPSVTEAIYESGFASSSRFYEHANAALGMPVRHYRQGGRSETLYFALGQIALGEVLIASSEQGLVCVLLGDDPDKLLQDAQQRFPKANWQGGVKEYEHQAGRVLAWLNQTGAELDLPVDLRGTVFQCQVWQALRQIPAGVTLSYTELAQRIGKPAAVRAVASACAANPLAVVVPCHRVLRRDGNMAGYAWGIARKQYLLQREKGLTA